MLASVDNNGAAEGRGGFLGELEVGDLIESQILIVLAARHGSTPASAARVH